MEETTLDEDIITTIQEDTIIQEDLTYTFYFEVNQSNYLSICSINTYSINYKGYIWDNIWNSNPNCNTCPNEGNNNYPIQNVNQKNQTIPLGEGGFTSPNNTFFLIDEIKGSDNVSVSCSSYISTLGCTPFTTSNLCMMNSPREEETTSYLEDDIEFSTPIEEKILLLDNNKDTYSQNVSCIGKECLTFFPPSELQYKNSYLYNPQENINNIIDCNSNNLQYSNGFPACFDNNWNPNQICYNGNPIFTYNIYKPLNYSKLPLLTNNTYTPPPVPMNAAFYNVYPFITKLEMEQSYLENGNNLPEGTYAVYKVSYSFNSNEYKKKENQVKDFLNLQIYLNTTFTSWFKKTTLFQTSQENLNQMIFDYCFYTNDNSSSICKQTFETFQYRDSSFLYKNRFIIICIIFIILLFLRFLKK